MQPFPTFSVFNNLMETNPVSLVSLDVYHARVISSIKMKDRFLKLRSADKPARDEMKKTLPCVTPSAQLKSRAANTSNRVVALTGLMQADIDGKDNPHINDWEGLRDELKSFAPICFCSISVSGQGIYGFVQVSDPELLPMHFQALLNDFAEMGIKLDPSKGSRPTDCRLYSYDSGAWLNPDAPIYFKTAEIPHKPVIVTPSFQPAYSDDKSMTLFDRFNQFADIPAILQRFGWRIVNSNGFKILFVRPGKQSGISADYDLKRRLLYVYSSSTSFLPDKAYNSIQVVKSLAGLSSWRSVNDYILQNHLI